MNPDDVLARIDAAIADHEHIQARLHDDDTDVVDWDGHSADAASWAADGSREEAWLDSGMQVASIDLVHFSVPTFDMHIDQDGRYWWVENRSERVTVPGRFYPPATD